MLLLQYGIVRRNLIRLDFKSCYRGTQRYRTLYLLNRYYNNHDKYETVPILYQHRVLWHNQTLLGSLRRPICQRYIHITPSCWNIDSENNSKDNVKNNENKDKNEVQQQQSLFRRLRVMVDAFWQGCKALFRDVRLAFHTRRKLGLYHAKDYSRLTREELRHMRQTKQDVVKTFPVALLFMVPFIGYAAPILAYFYPKQLLSQQFWHPDQKQEFVLEEYEKRSQYYLPLIKEVGVTAKELKKNELLRFCLKTLDGTHPDNQLLLQYQYVFSNHEEFSLQKMPRYHLVKICKCWLIPTGWYLPRWFLISALKKRISRLHQDDVLILRDGIETLTAECIEEAVHCRGLDEASLCDNAKKHWLNEWIRLSAEVTEKDVSFLAHCAVFKAANFERIENGNSNMTIT